MRREEVTDRIRNLMSPADRELYSSKEDKYPVVYEEPKTDRLEREEQRQFASWCLLRNFAPIWHSTAHRSKASIGCPDFLLTVNGYTLAIEFKRVGFELSAGQEDWKSRHESNGGIYYIVYSAGQAITLCEKYAQIERLNIRHP